MYSLAATDHRGKYVSVVLSLESVSLMWLPSNNRHPTGTVQLSWQEGSQSQETPVPLYSSIRLLKL